MGTNGYLMGINPLGYLMGNGYPPFKGIPLTLYPLPYPLRLLSMLNVNNYKILEAKMGDESFTFEGLSIGEIKRSMAILQAKKIKAYAKRAALTIRIDEAKLASDDAACKIVGPEKIRLAELKEKRDKVDLYIYALDEVLKQSQRALTNG